MHDVNYFDFIFVEPYTRIPLDLPFGAVQSQIKFLFTQKCESSFVLKSNLLVPFFLREPDLLVSNKAIKSN
jgi:hypothetical protein